MQQLTEHIYCMENDPRTDQPFIYLICGERISIQIDAGNSPENYHRFLNQIRENHLPLPSMVAISHWHWDHTFGMVAAKVPILASKKTELYLEKVKNWQWTEEAMKERVSGGEDIQFCFECMHQQYPDIRQIQVRTADIVFEDNIEIDLGKVRVQAIVRDSPHCRDSVLYYVPCDHALLAADAEYEDYYDNNSKYDPLRLESYILFLERLDFKWYMRGHDTAVLTKCEILEKLKNAYHTLKMNHESA